ncbi:class I SAM-dependent methyltransferase [Candidatus Pelagibacter sp.]|nr:class I SAM-dependent methyltransferase [Candidatus Pelagibacter sp.]
MISKFNKFLDKIIFDKHRNLRSQIIDILKSNKKYDYGNGYLYQSFDKVPLRGLRNTKYRIRELRIDQFTLNKKILDIGCNTGFLSMSIKPIYKKLVGIDHHQISINIANLVRDYLSMNKVHFLHENFNYFKFDDTFDVIFSLANHSTKDKGIIDTNFYFKKIDQLLNNKGLLFIESHHPQIEKNSEFKKKVSDFINNYNYKILYKNKYNCKNFYDYGRTFYILKKEV